MNSLHIEGGVRGGAKDSMEPYFKSYLEHLSSIYTNAIENQLTTGDEEDVEASRIFCSCLGGVTRLFFINSQNKEMKCATAFIVYEGDYTILMSCAHTFREVPFPTPTLINLDTEYIIEVVSCDMIKRKAEMLYIDMDRDLCLIRVRECLGGNVTCLQFGDRRAVVGDKCFCISNPGREIVSDEELVERGLDVCLFNCEWFLYSQGQVSQSSTYGVQGSGSYMHFHMDGVGYGSSGGPIMDRDGRVIGVYSLTCGRTFDNTIQYAANYTSIRDFLIDSFLIRSSKANVNEILQTYLPRLAQA